MIEFLHSPSNKETMAVAYPLISDILAQIAVLPASSAEVERVFSAMKRIKTPVRNRLKTGTLDHLLRILIEGPEVRDWDPLPALKSGNHEEIDKFKSHDSCRHIMKLCMWALLNFGYLKQLYCIPTLCTCLCIYNCLVIIIEYRSALPSFLIWGVQQPLKHWKGGIFTQ